MHQYTSIIIWCAYISKNVPGLGSGFQSFKDISKRPDSAIGDLGNFEDSLEDWRSLF